MSAAAPPEGLEIRRATPSDLVGLLGLIEQFCVADAHPFDVARIADALTPLVSDASLGQVWVADNRTHLLGYAVLTWGYSLESGGRESLLDEIYVAQRGMGIGSALMSAAIEGALLAGARVMFLETEHPNSRAREFYRRHGFTLEDSLWMSRPLGPLHMEDKASA